MTLITKSNLILIDDIDIKLHLSTITNEENELFQFANQKAELEKLKTITAPQKRLEYLTSLRLVKQQFGKNSVLSKNKYGAPFINGEAKYVSLSHSFPKVVLAISDYVCGVDVEEIKPKVLRIASKFLNPFEIEQTENTSTKTTLFWSAKETIFKIYQKGAVDFKDHIHLKLLDDESIKAQFLKENGFEIILKYKVLEPYVLVYGVLK